VLRKPQWPSSSVLGMSLKLAQKKVTYWITSVISRSRLGFFLLLGGLQQSKSQLCIAPVVMMAVTTASEKMPVGCVLPSQNWSFWRPKEKRALVVGRELVWIPEPFQLVLKLKKQFMKTVRISVWGTMALWCLSHF